MCFGYAKSLPSSELCDGLGVWCLIGDYQSVKPCFSLATKPPSNFRTKNHSYPHISSRTVAFVFLRSFDIVVFISTQALCQFLHELLTLRLVFTVYKIRRDFYRVLS